MSDTDQNMVAKTEAGADQQSPHGIPISGRFGQYDSSFWKAALAIIGVRYLPLPFLRDTLEKGPHFYKRQIYSGVSGLGMEAITGYFAYRTWKDMRNIFSGALAWEFDKDPKEVNFSDFRNSKNTMVQQTIGNYVKYNLRRFAVNLTFFLPLALGGLFKKFGVLKNSKWGPDNWHGEAGANLGVGVNSAYLFSDVISRKQTPFELLQATIDRKINHAEHFGDQITATDLLDIYERHAANGMIVSFLGQRGTPQWEQSMTLFSRMADLMNKTYKNTTSQEYADFGIDDFIYMVGNKLIDPANVERSCAYIEIANRYDIPTLKQAVKEAGDKDVATLLQKYPVSLPVEGPVVPPAEGKKYADGLAPAAGLRTMLPPPAAYTDKLAKDADPSYSLSA